MSDISALEGRITAALDRIRRGLDAQEQQTNADDGLQALLDAERAAKNELEETVRQLREQHDTEVSSLTNRVESQRDQMRQLDVELQRLRASNAQLREMNTSLREAVTTGLSPELLDQAVAAEIEALVAQRAAEAAEMEAILAELKPLVAEDTHAAG